jgi:heat shock protein HtpX
MRYVGLQTQRTRNNIRSVALLFLFPVLVVLLSFLFTYLFLLTLTERTDEIFDLSLSFTYSALPYVIGGVLIWFLIAYFANTRIIRSATKARSLERKDNKRVYNLVENLCISKGMRTPKIQIINDSSLNAYASGINEHSYAIALSRGIIDKLDDEELEGVIAHELSHIRNRDVRLLIVSIVFVGIFAMIAEISIRLIASSSRRSRKGNLGVLLLIAFLVAIIGYFFSSLMRFAISRKREYLADASAAELTRNPQALASALRKISKDPEIEAITRDDVAQLFIEHPKRTSKSIFSGLTGLFATHPPIRKRIEILEQF